MFIIDGELYWGVSDLVGAAQCEFDTLRRMDYARNRATRPEHIPDELMVKIAELGDAHEAQVLADYQARQCVVSIPRPAEKSTVQGLQHGYQVSLRVIAEGPDVVAQPWLFDGEFLGFPDFLENTPDGWVVVDAKVARSSKTSALLQLGSYAYLLQKSGVRVAPKVALHLGDGRREEYRAADVIPVFLEFRAQLRELAHYHDGLSSPVAWGDGFLTTCGSCEECAEAIQKNDDLFIVAGIRADQRKKLRHAGIETVKQLAHAASCPPGLSDSTFKNLRLQAYLQWKQAQRSDDRIEYVLTESAGDTFARLPKPSEGDLFFDFEGDPLFQSDDRRHFGLEYLWGISHANGAFEFYWADDDQQEKVALEKFMDLVKRQREKHPGMHVYHYASYEVTALKRLTARYQTREEELDDFLKAHVFVDLYATVRGSLRVGQDSYSIKKLEPLYMEEERNKEKGSVSDGGASVVAYHEYRETRQSDPSEAQRLREEIVTYNKYDCVSTLKLRDWLLERAYEISAEVGVAVGEEGNTESSPAADKEADVVRLREKLLEKAKGSPNQSEARAYEMLAAALGYFRRENLQFWWEHYARLESSVSEWSDTRGVYTVESVEVVKDWHDPGGRATKHRRSLILHGKWALGSQMDSTVYALYENPDLGGSTYTACRDVSVKYEGKDEDTVVIEERMRPEKTSPALPVALTPGVPPSTDGLAKAIEETVDVVVNAQTLPSLPELDVLARRAPRIDGGLPSDGDVVADIVAALTSTEDSYVAVQGPPGTGKTYTGSRVIKQLVEDHQWEIGVVAQSHATVENMLQGVIDAGLSAALIGKKPKSGDASSLLPWTNVPDRNTSKFLRDHRGGGCVLGGTMWDFSNKGRVGRRELDLLVIDEAGQFSLAATLAAAVSAKRLLLLGDPQQLPQVSQGTHPEPVDLSALEWVMNGAPTIPRGYGYFLAETYRMSPELCAQVSTLSYQDELFAADAATKRNLVGVAPGIEVITVPHVGNTVESTEEANVVVDKVRELLGCTWRDPHENKERTLEETDFLVVAPYNAQVSMIRKTLDKAGLSGVQVGTVDKFQGREAPVSILSMTASSSEDVPRGIGFILNRNRVNVAISRAQWLSVIIRSENLTKFMPASVDTFLDLGGFLGLGARPEE